MSAIGSILLYLAVFGLSAYIIQFGYKRKSKIFQAIGLLLPIIFGGLRYDVGLDYMAYFNAYADVVNPKSTYRYDGTPGLEITFRVIAHISDFLTSSPVVLFLVYSAITVIAFYAALRLMRPKNVGYAMFFFYAIFFLNSFNIMRQGAAMSIGALALVYFAKGYRGRASLYILLASLFHVSALLLFVYVGLVWLLEKRYLSRKSGYRFFRSFMGVFIVSLSVAAAGLSVAAVGVFIYDTTGRIGTYDTVVSTGVVFKYLLSLTCLYPVVYTWRYFNANDKRLSLLVALGVVVYALGIVHNESARIGMYLIILIPILTAVTYDYLDNRYLKSGLFLSLGVVGLSALYIVSVHFSNGEGVQYGYQSILGLDTYQLEVRRLAM